MLRDAMRPAYLTPKLTDAHRLEIRRLRREDRRTWTLAKLAQRFGVHRSTIAHALRRRVRVNVEQELDGLRMAAETTGPICTVELMRLKRQEWSRALLAECDLGRQQQLVHLIKSVESMLDPAKLREQEYRCRTPEDREKEIRLAVAVLTQQRKEREGRDFDSKQPLPQTAEFAAGAA
jgi:AraC-like DNA-binding protein